MLDLNAGMARVRDEEEFRVNDPFDDPLGATDNGDKGRWIGIVSARKPKNTRLAPSMLNLWLGALLAGISASKAVR